jgi:hypothetical protein
MLQCATVLHRNSAATSSVELNTAYVTCLWALAVCACCPDGAGGDLGFNAVKRRGPCLFLWYSPLHENIQLWLHAR